MKQGTAVAERMLRCPRCGYDQRGTIATWADACPLAGVCTECGVSFAWSDLLNPSRQAPMWCIEHPRHGVLRFLLSIPRTLAMAWRPWRFWRELRLENVIHWRRLAVFVLVQVVALYVVTAGLAGWLVYEDLRAVRNVAALRAGTTVQPAAPDWQLVLRPAVTPWSTTPNGTWTTPGMPQQPLAAPAVAMRFAAASVLTPAGFGALALLLMALTFGVLPVSRRRAKVRWAHIWRMTIYGTGLVWLPALAGLVFAGQVVAGRPMLFGAGPAVMAIAGLLSIIAGFLWWWFGTARYLRMTQAWAVALSVTIVGLLGAIVVAASVEQLLE